MRALLTAEWGTAWQMWVDRLRQKHRELLTVAQEPQEPASAFVERAIDRLAGQPIFSSATMLCGTETGLAVDDARGRLATAFATAIGGGLIVLVPADLGSIGHLQGLALRLALAHGVAVRIEPPYGGFR